MKLFSIMALSTILLGCVSTTATLANDKQAVPPKTPSPATSSFSKFNIKAQTANMVFYFGITDPYATPKARINAQQAKNYFSRFERVELDLKNQTILVMNRNSNYSKKCTNANFTAKSVPIYSYFNNTYGMNEQKAQNFKDFKSLKVNTATLVRFNCPIVDWPSELLILKSKQQIETEGLTYPSRIILDYQGVLYSGNSGLLTPRPILPRPPIKK